MAKGTPTFEESRSDLIKAELDRADAQYQQATESYNKQKEIANRYRQQHSRAQAELKKVLQNFNTTDVQRNPFFTEQALTKASEFKTKHNVSARSIQRAFASQKEKLEKYQSLAQQHLKKAETLKSTKNTTAYLNAQSDYWICVHNYDYYASRFYIEAEACEQELKLYINRENAELAKQQAARRLLIEKTDALTYGIVTPEKVKRLTAAMSISQVEKIIGPGAPIRSFSIYVGPVKIELDEYQWSCIDGNGVLTILFDKDKLYQKDVAWSGRPSSQMSGRD